LIEQVRLVFLAQLAQREKRARLACERARKRLASRLRVYVRRPNHYTTESSLPRKKVTVTDVKSVNLPGEDRLMNNINIRETISQSERPCDVTETTSQSARPRDVMIYVTQSTLTCTCCTQTTCTLREVHKSLVLYTV